MASATAERKKNQELPGMETTKTPLGKAAEDFCDQKDRIAKEKENLAKIGERIVDAMIKESRAVFTVKYEGEKYRFEVVEGKRKLKCTKAQISENGN